MRDGGKTFDLRAGGGLKEGGKRKSLGKFGRIPEQRIPVPTFEAK